MERITTTQKRSHFLFSALQLSILLIVLAKQAVGLHKANGLD